MDSWKSIIEKYGANAETVLPGDDVQGEPFWVLMEIKNGKNTGNYHSIGKRENRTLIMFFPQREMADWAAGVLSRHSNDYMVRGVSTEHLKVLLRLCEDGYPLELVVAASELNPKGELCGAVMSPHQIREILSL